jgi:N-acetylglucosamine-6-sulfatase
MTVRGIGAYERRRRGTRAVSILVAVVVMAFAWVPTGSLDRIAAAVITTPGAISIGDTVTGAASAGSVDNYRLFLPAAGTSLVLRVTNAECGCEWSLTGPNGTVFDETLGDFGPRWLAGGDYTIAVTGSTSGAYQFDVASAPAPQSLAIDLGAVVSNGNPTAGAGNIESPGAQDAYAFTVPSGGASVMLGVLANNCACEWSLRAVNGPLVFDREPIDNTRVGLAAGSYSLRVAGTGANTGTYSFEVRAAPAPNRFTIVLGDTVADGMPGPGAGNLETPGAIDVYSFAATAGSTISVAGSGCSVDASYALVAPSTRILGRAALCGAHDVIALPDESGTYEVRVSASTTGTGTYGLQIGASSDPATVTYPAADVFALAAGTTVADGSPANGAGNIEVAQSHDVYGIDGTAGQTIVLDDTTAGGCSALSWSAYAPDGAPMAVDQQLGCPGSRSLRIDETGRYNIDVHGSVAATGTYSFIVRVAPSAQKFAVAIPATVSHGVPGTGAGTLETAGSTDVYTFTATRGASVVVSDATSGGCVPIDATIVTADDVANPPLQLGCAGQTIVAVDRTGPFAVVVTGRAATTGNYSLRVRTSPPAATALSVAKREGAVALTWTAPTGSGGLPITNAQVSVFSASGAKPSNVAGALVRTVDSASASYTFTGLTNGVSYRFVVREQNGNGLGVPSAQSATVAPAANSRPNILFVLTDDQRGDSLPQVPKLNAQTSWLRFANSFVEEPMCCPSRSTIFTGRYSHHTNVQTLLQGQNLDDQRTIATMLKAVGYRTGFLGKYLNGYPFTSGNPVPPGWDDFEAYEGATDYYNYTVNRNGTPVQYGSTPADYSTDVWTGRADNFIRTADPSKPFFLEVAYNAPHFSRTGYAIPAPRDIGSCANVSFPLPASFNAHDQISEPPWLASQPARSVDIQDASLRATCETLRAVDDGVVSLIDLLASIGRLSNTYIVFMSDNGYEFGEHSLVGKGDLYEESIRVPLMVRGPGVVPGTANRLTSNVDLVPTFLTWAKTSAPAGFLDGASWAANARGVAAGATFPSSVLLRGCRTSDQQVKPACGGAYGLPMGMNWGLRTATYKYIEYPSGYKQLFDLVHDPNELRNIAGDPTKATIVANLHAQLVAKRAT